MTGEGERPRASVLDAGEIVKTIDRLSHRIDARFPGSGLFRTSRELHRIAVHARDHSRWIARPVAWLRVGSAAAVGAMIATSGLALWAVRWPRGEDWTLDLVVPLLEAGMNDLVLVGAAIFFLTSLESRWKRRRALVAIHELRSVAHVVDMHQLTKDPERLRSPERRTSVSPRPGLSRYELGRYLDYCSELLSLTGKIGAVYVQHFDDAAAIVSVNEVETLCTGLSRKCWQKLMVLQTLPEGVGEREAEAEPPGPLPPRPRHAADPARPEARSAEPGLWQRVRFGFSRVREWTVGAEP